MSTLERAIALAAEMHAGASDKGGQPYILHPLRVMLAVKGEQQRIVAVLHDIVEDTPVTLEQLREMGFDPVVVDAVDAITKRDGEDYQSFVERAAANEIARAVKLADVEDNMDLTRIAEPTERDSRRVEDRYRPARKFLQMCIRAAGVDLPAAPTIMPLRPATPLRDILERCPGDHEIHVCDFYVQGAEHWDLERGGLRRGRMLNVDHHAPLPVMDAPLTSTHFACEHLADRASSALEGMAWTVVNHTDCDSMLSSAILMGYIAPSAELVRASVCADHTGEPHPIADLLQALDEARHGDRTEAQWLESLRNLQHLLAGEPLEPVAVDALHRRAERVSEARRLVEAGAFVSDGPLAFATLDREIDGAFFPPLLPDAVVIMLAAPDPRDSARTIVKLRLGHAAPAGLTLHTLGITELDPAYGGRWNAGSNKRGGGSTLPPWAYAAMLRRRVEGALDGYRRPPS